MKYPCFRVSQGRTALANYRESEISRARVEPEMRVIRNRQADPGVEQAIEALQDVLSVDAADRVAKRYSGSQRRDKVEGELSLNLFEITSDLPAQILGDPDFWRYIAVETIRDFVMWRDGRDCSAASFGLNSQRRIPDCVPLRMFNRALLAHEAGGGSQALAQHVTAGGADFWQSHVLRVHTRFDPRVVEFLADSVVDRSIANVDVLREVAKEIKQLRSNVVLELVQEQSLKRLLSDLVERCAT